MKGRTWGSPKNPGVKFGVKEAKFWMKKSVILGLKRVVWARKRFLG